MWALLSRFKAPNDLISTKNLLNSDFLGKTYFKIFLELVIKNFNLNFSLKVEFEQSFYRNFEESFKHFLLKIWTILFVKFGIRIDS
jgi:hypothetical protein